MVTAIVLLHVEHGHVNDVAAALLELPGVAEVYSVAGPYDLVAILRVRDTDAVAAVVTDRMLQLPGIARSETLIAFRAYSKHDLDRLFGVGLEG
jgi:DNA-binding Lrp family transcriptional regulator